MTTQILTRPLPEIQEETDITHDPRFRPGTWFRVDCAVNRLGPRRARPCSTESVIAGRLCEQHQFLTPSECARRADDCEQKAAVAEQRAPAIANDFDRSWQDASARWLRNRAEDYRQLASD